jgi:hypothetical protein
MFIPSEIQPQIIEIGDNVMYHMITTHSSRFIRRWFDPITILANRAIPSRILKSAFDFGAKGTDNETDIWRGSHALVYLVNSNP